MNRRRLSTATLLTLLRSRGWMPTFLLRDDFTTDDAAPLTSPRTCEPGPGTLTAVQTDGQLSISGGKLAFPAQTTPAWGDQGLYNATGRARTNGRALLATLNLSTWEECGVGWHTAAAVADPDNFSQAIQAHATDGQLDNQHGQLVYSGLSTSTDYPLAFVQGAARNKSLIKVGGTWYVVWIGTDTTATVYAAFANLDGVGTLDGIRVLDLPAPFDDDYGLATQRVSGSVSAGQTYTHEADCLIEYGWTGATDFSGAKFVTVSFRRQDSSNLWKVQLRGNNVVDLLERVAGVDTSRGSASGIPNGRVVIVASGTTIRVYVANVLRITYASASNFADKTDGSVLAIDGDSKCTNLISWPRTLSGDAATILDQAVA